MPVNDSEEAGKKKDEVLKLLKSLKSVKSPTEKFVCLIPYKPVLKEYLVFEKLEISKGEDYTKCIISSENDFEQNEISHCLKIRGINPLSKEEKFLHQAEKNLKKIIKKHFDETCVRAALKCKRILDASETGFTKEVFLNAIEKLKDTVEKGSDIICFCTPKHFVMLMEKFNLPCDRFKSSGLAIGPLGVRFRLICEDSTEKGSVLSLENEGKRKSPACVMWSKGAIAAYEIDDRTPECDPRSSEPIQINIHAYCMNSRGVVAIKLPESPASGSA